MFIDTGIHEVFRLARRTGLMLGVGWLAISTVHAETTDATNDGATNDGGGIVVTATRRAQVLDKVPLKIDALNQAQMDQRGIRAIDDVARYTPGLLFTQTGGVAGNSSTNISIRGIASNVGSATTAIYIDDTPIQIRNIGYFGGNPYPRLFDLDRVEVLKGPQGTLFGAGAEGGAVRFITPNPGLDHFSEYARGEVAATEHGGISYETGAAIGGPIIKDTLGFRLSASYRRDGGYIDQIDATTGKELNSDVNWSRTTVVRGALTYTPTSALTITPSIFYQDQYQNARDQYWESFSNLGTANYKDGNTIAEPTRDRFVIPAVHGEYDFGGAKLVSNSSYFWRRQEQVLDYTNYLRALNTGNALTTLAGLYPSSAKVTTYQRNFTQEVRLQSNHGGRIDWTVGAYYSDQRQSQQNLTDSSALGGNAVNGYAYTDAVWSKDQQIAGFANIDVHITPKLTVSAGGRVSHLTFTFSDAAGGTVNGGDTFVSGRTSETPVTPKFGIAYQADAHTLLYANAAKGFRQGGAQAPVPATFCSADLATLGVSQSPTSYKADSVWSYDGGVKAGLFGGKAHIDANAYWIKWNNIQQSVSLPNCGFSYITNLGKADSRGVDLTFDLQVAKPLKIGANLGYNRTTYAGDVVGGAGVLLAAQGDRIGGPQLTGTGWGQIDIPLGGDHQGYLRGDVTFRSKGISPDPATFSYDAGLTATRPSAEVSLRMGTTWQGADVSFFINNLTNNTAALSRTHDVAGSSLYYDYGYRPRTFGLTLTYKN